MKYNLSVIPGFNELVNPDYISTLNTNILKLNKIECRTNNSTYKVIRYDKNFLCVDLIPTYGLCRSVILNSVNQIVGFAPPKSLHADIFINKYPENTNGIQAEEFVEGTMINVFFDQCVGVTGSWEISTRNTVGATSSFFKSHGAKTFRQMFMEAAGECKLDINKLDTALCYSFVLQHPENRIVVPFSKAQLYLVGVYNINNSIDNNSTVDYLDVHGYKDFFNNELGTTVKFPQIYQFHKYSDLIEKYGSMNTSYDIVGVIIHNKETGERTKIRNPVYEQVRNLRGNQPKLQYQYLCLRKEGKVKDFLTFYPENKPEFSTFRDQVHLFTNTLYSNYVSCYIKKEKPLLDFSQQYRTHMFNIHQIYMNELREKKQFINNTVVQKYVNELHPSLLMYCLNFQLRKRNIDTIVAENEEH
jgi:hypothetical protein